MASSSSHASKLTGRTYLFSKEQISEDGSTRSHSFAYDVFVGYDMEDHAFVMDHIIQHLDNEYSGDYKCAYAVKDFAPGYSYKESINKALDKSYWTFIVFSKNSVKSGTTAFLYQQAMLKFEDRRILPIRIDECKIPESLEESTVDLDFTLMDPEDFYKRLLGVVSGKTCLLPDDRQPTLRPQRPKPTPGQAPASFPKKSWPKNPSLLTDITDPSETEYPATQPTSVLSQPFFKTKKIDPTTALLRKVPNSSPEQFSSELSAKKEPHEDKWSAEAFHDNPEQYIENFNRVNISSRNFHKFEHTLLHDILPEVSDRGFTETIHVTCLARLTYCPSHVIKKRVFSLLGKRLIQDDLHSPTLANGLMETEVLFRESLLGKTYQTETADFQSSRLQMYGRLLFYVAMHIEKGHLTSDMPMVQRVYEVNKMVVDMLKQLRKLSYHMAYSLTVVNHGYIYLRNLVDNNEVSSSALSEQIADISKVNDFEHYTPPFLLEKSLRMEKHWIYMDIILSSVGNLIFHDHRYIHVLLRHLPLFVKPYPAIRNQVRTGVQLNVARILVSLISCHERKDIRMAAMLGLNSPDKSRGLECLWNTVLYRVEEYKGSLNDIVMPLILTSLDSENRSIIHKSFFCSVYSPRPEIRRREIVSAGHMEMHEENLMMNLIRDRLVLMYEWIGDKLDFRSQTLIHNNYHIMEGYFNHTTQVVVKVPRVLEQDQMVDPAKQSPARRLLQNELDVLQTLSHKHVVTLISGSASGAVPLHCIIERLDGGNLQTFLRQGRHLASPHRASRRQLFDMVIQVGEALKYLAHRGVVHRDICAYNVLMHETPNSSVGAVKLAGFSLARRVGCNAREEAAQGTSPDDGILLRWSDPQSLLTGYWSLQTDLWMFWCFVYEVFTYGTHPFPEFRVAADIPNAVKAGYSIQQPLCIPNDLNLLIQKGLQSNIKKRTTITMYMHALCTLKEDWQNNNREENRKAEIHYPPVHDHFKNDRMSPAEFQSMFENRTRKNPTASAKQAMMEFKILPSLDMVDVSEMDQPRDGFTNMLSLCKGLNLVRVNYEIFKADQEKQEVLECLREFNSENLCRIFNIKLDQNEATLITELDLGGDILETMLHCPSAYTMEHAVSYAVQVLKGLQVLHTKYSIVHTDLRAQYVYTGPVIPGQAEGYFRVKIGRLARCKKLFRSHLDEEGRTHDTQPVPIDSLRWAPLEVIKSPAFYSRASDIYSFGLLFWQLVYVLQAGDEGDVDSRLVVPYPEWRLDRAEFHGKLMMARHPTQPERCADWAYLLLKMCLRGKHKRPSIDFLLETLTKRQPFKSSLLEPVQQQLENSSHRVNIDFSEEQAIGAPYLEVNYEPLTDTPDPVCLSTHFQEYENYYLKNARFGFTHYSLDDPSLLPLPGSLETSDQVRHGEYVNVDMDNEHTQLLDYNTNYHDVLVTSESTNDSSFDDNDFYDLKADEDSAGAEDDIYQAIGNEYEPLPEYLDQSSAPRDSQIANSGFIQVSKATSDCDSYANPYDWQK